MVCAFLWTIWLDRNGVCFNNGKMKSFRSFAALLISLVIFWTYGRPRWKIQKVNCRGDAYLPRWIPFLYSCLDLLKRSRVSIRKERGRIFIWVRVFYCLFLVLVILNSALGHEHCPFLSCRTGHDHCPSRVHWALHLSVAPQAVHWVLLLSVIPENELSMGLASSSSVALTSILFLLGRLWREI